MLAQPDPERRVQAQQRRARRAEAVKFMRCSLFYTYHCCPSMPERLSISLLCMAVRDVSTDKIHHLESCATSSHLHSLHTTSPRKHMAPGPILYAEALMLFPSSKVSPSPWSDSPRHRPARAATLGSASTPWDLGRRRLKHACHMLLVELDSAVGSRTQFRGRRTSRCGSYPSEVSNPTGPNAHHYKA